MRLNKFTIGSAKDSLVHQFKNLKNVTIDFDQDHWVTVVIGWNGTGKSNVLEALAIIFRELIHSKKPNIGFAFKLEYSMGSGDESKHIHIDADPDRAKDSLIIHLATHDEAYGVGTLIPHIEDEVECSALRGKQIKLTQFLKEESYLPKYVFSYYSGESTRMHEVFRPYLESYDNKLRNGEDPGLKRLFYAMPVHSQFVLLAFMTQQSDVVREFLDDHLGLDPDEGIESVLFVLRQPPWKSKAPDGDPRFWMARGVVRDFLARLYDIALAPIEVTRRVSTSLWNKETLQFKYLYVKDIGSLRKLVGKQPPAEFFRDLESTYVSELIEEVRIKIRLKKNDGTVIFRELSEGEQQLLTVLGLMRFTAEDESLFLLDEPDTHLNPKWTTDYIRYLKEFVGNDGVNKNTSHIVLTTHNPLAIAELTREQVQILHRDDAKDNGATHSTIPAFDPRGMGYAGIITSDMFGLASSLDTHTSKLLERKRELSLTEENLSSPEREELSQINLVLDGYGFRYASRDPIFEEYLKARYSFDKPKPEDKKLVNLTSESRSKTAKRLLDGVMQKINDRNED